jgi:plasmid stabilization system protein ParE
MDEYKIDISDYAKQDIRDMATYIRDELLEPAFADSTTEAVLSAISKLDFMPARIPLVKNERLAKQKIRGLQIKNYTVFFRIDEALKTVDVVRVLYSRRDWQTIL